MIFQVVNRKNSFVDYSYNSADRLTNWIVNSSAYTANYSGNGNIVRKSDFGLYAYSGSRPHAVSGISSLIAGTGEERTCEAEYNTIGKVSKLTLKNGSTTLKTATFTYAADGQRRKMVVGSTTTIYCDDYQVNKNGSTEQRLHYISGPTGLCALIVQTISDQHTSREIYYLQTDYQGSIIAAYYSNGILYKSFAYDPWGRRRAGDNWTNYQASTETLITRGYCGHEHLDDFGTINMNGRIYDPRLGRFLSPDPYVQAPYNSQNYNRYSYCWNNPLKYTDPDGEWIHIVIGAIVGGVVNWATHGCDFTWEGLGYFGVGVLAGAASAAVGGGVSSALAGGSFWAGAAGTSTVATTGFCGGAVVGAATGGTSGFIIGAGNGAIDGNSFKDCFISGFDYSWKGALTGAVAGGIQGGIDAVVHKQNFWTGAKKQDIVFQIDGDNEANTVAGSDFDRQSYNGNHTTKVDANNPNIEIEQGADGSYVHKIKVPKNVDGVTAFASNEGAVTTSSSLKFGLNRKITITSFNKIDHITFHGYRWTSTPVNGHFKLSYLFNGRSFKYIW